MIKKVHSGLLAGEVATLNPTPPLSVTSRYAWLKARLLHPAKRSVSLRLVKSKAPALLIKILYSIFPFSFIFVQFQNFRFLQAWTLVFSPTQAEPMPSKRGKRILFTASF